MAWRTRTGSPLAWNAMVCCTARLGAAWWCAEGDPRRASSQRQDARQKTDDARPCGAAPNVGETSGLGAARPGPLLAKWPPWICRERRPQIAPSTPT
jgi:hypothetical protein